MKELKEDGVWVNSEIDKFANKILLPESVLYSLHQNEENNELEFPLFFKVYNCNKTTN